MLKAGIEAKEAEKVYADMQTLAQNYSQMPALRITIDNPMLSNAQKESLLLLATGGEPCELTKRFVALVLKEEREVIAQIGEGAGKFISTESAKHVRKIIVGT